MRKIYYMFVFMLLITVLTSGAPTQKDLLLKIVTQDQAWSDSNLDKKIITELSRRSDIRIQLVSQQEPEEPRYPDDIYDLDSLTNWGREKGARYLMQIELSSQHFEKRKTFHIPLVAHKYETIGVVEGEMRFIDLMQGKLLAAEPFQIEEKGTSLRFPRLAVAS